MRENLIEHRKTPGLRQWRYESNSDHAFKFKYSWKKYVNGFDNWETPTITISFSRFLKNKNILKPIIHTDKISMWIKYIYYLKTSRISLQKIKFSTIQIHIFMILLGRNMTGQFVSYKNLEKNTCRKQKPLLFHSSIIPLVINIPIKSVINYLCQRGNNHWHVLVTVCVFLVEENNF